MARNVFGGILRCDILAQGVVDAVKSVNVNVPVIIRMEGTNVEEGRNILESSGLDLKWEMEWQTLLKK